MTIASSPPLQVQKYRYVPSRQLNLHTKMRYYLVKNDSSDQLDKRECERIIALCQRKEKEEKSFFSGYIHPSVQVVHPYVGLQIFIHR